MRIARPALYVAFGMVLGVTAALVAQQPVVQQGTGPRLTAVSIGNVAHRPAYFVRDAASGGCWLVLGYGTGDASPSVAVAPPAACEK